MAQEVKLMGATYSNVPSILVPDSVGNYHSFIDTSDATATADKIMSGYTAYVGGTKLTGTSPGGTAITVTDTTDSGGGTIRAITGMEWATMWLPPSATLVGSSEERINISSDTSYDTWTPTTSNTSIKAAGSARAALSYTISGETNCQNVSAIGVCLFHTHYDYGSNTPAKAYQKDKLIYGLAYYVPMKMNNYNNDYYGVYGTSVTGRQIYYSSASALSVYASATYALGMTGVTFSISSATSTSSRSIGFTRPAVYARCSSSYFSTAAANALDSTASYIDCKYKLWTMPKEENIFYTMFDANNGLFFT